MRSRTVLGLIAFLAIIVAAISFAVVDISTSAAGVCLRASPSCAVGEDSARATVFAIVGAVALLGAVVPAVAWLVNALSPLHPVAEEQPESEPAEAPPVATLTGD